MGARGGWKRATTTRPLASPHGVRCSNLLLSLVVVRVDHDVAADSLDPDTTQPTDLVPLATADQRPQSLILTSYAFGSFFASSGTPDVSVPDREGVPAPDQRESQIEEAGFYAQVSEPSTALL